MKERYAIEWVNVQDIHENRDNPNAMNEQEFTALISEIKLNGFLQPIVTRICKCEIISKEHRVLISGEHRWLAAQNPDIAMKEIPCIDIDLNDEDAKLLMVNLNRIHGNFIPLKLAGLVVDLNKKIPTEELQKRLYVPKDELLGIMYPKASESIKINANNPLKENKILEKQTTLFTVAMSKEQFDKVNETLELVIHEKKCKRPEALITICEAYNEKVQVIDEKQVQKIAKSESL